MRIRDKVKKPQRPVVVYEIVPIQGTIHNHKLMETIIVMGSANIQGSNKS